MSLTNNIWLSVYGSLMSNAALSGLEITRDEYPSGVRPSINGDIHIGLKGGKIIRLLAASELQQYNLKVGVATRGNSTFDTACDVHKTIRETLEPADYTLSGGDLIYCLAQDLPMQEDSKPIDYVYVNYVMEIQVV